MRPPEDLRLKCRDPSYVPSYDGVDLACLSYSRVIGNREIFLVSVPITIAEELRQDGTTVLSANRLASRLALTVDELAAVAVVHFRTMGETHELGAFQALMHHVVRVISATMDISGNRGRALKWLKKANLGSFGGKTPFALIGDGRTNNLCLTGHAP